MFEMRKIRWVVVFSVGLVTALAAPWAAAVHPEMSHDLPTPPAAEGLSAAERAFSVFWCTCSDDRTMRLSDASCACEEADEDRAILQASVERAREKDIASGAAALPAVLNGVQDTPRLLKALDYPQADFDHLWETSKSTCPAELGRVFRYGPISCHTRARWMLRFKAMLAMGFSVDQIFEFYVEESNAHLEPESPWTVENLRYKPSSSATFLIPILVAVLALMALVGFRRFRNRGKRRTAPTGPTMSAADRALLEDELDDF